jgi:hypothetical protein
MTAENMISRPAALLLCRELPIRAVMNRLEIDVLKLISTEIWGGEGAIVPDPLISHVAPSPAPVPVPVARVQLRHSLGQLQAPPTP